MPRWPSWIWAVLGLGTTIALGAAASGAAGGSRRLPRGLGITAPNTYTSDPEQFADWMADLGVTHVNIQGEHFSTMSGKPERWYDEELPKFAAALQSRGIDVVIFGWVTPWEWRAEADRLIKSARRADAIAIRVNAEKPWKPGTPEQRQAAADLVAYIQDAGFPVIVSTYGGGARWFSSSFPWEQWAEADAVAPQWYSQDPEDRADRYTHFREMGFTTILPTLGAAAKYSTGSKKGQSRTKERMIAEAESTQHDGAIAYWSWGHVRNQSSRWEVLQGLDVGDHSTTYSEAS